MLVEMVTAPILARLGHDFRFLLVVFGIEHLVGNSLPLEHLAELFRLLDIDGADEHGAAHPVEFLDFLDHRPEFLPLRSINAVGIVDADHLPVSRNDHHIQLVDLGEFRRFCFRRAGHTSQFLVHAEIVLKGDGSQSLVFVFDSDAFLGFQRLVKPFAVPSSRHETPGELIHNDDLSTLHDVVHVPLEEGMGTQSLVDVVQDGDASVVIEVSTPRRFPLGRPLLHSRPLFGSSPRWCNGSPCEAGE